MPASDFLHLARDEPGRAIAYSVLPVLVAVAQLSNALYHDVSALFPGLFALALIAFAVLATQYHVAVRRITETYAGTTGRAAD